MPAPPGFLSPSQQDRIATYLDKKINIPLVSTKREHDIFLKLVRYIDGLVNINMPDEMLVALNDPNIQIEGEVVGALKEHLVPLLSANMAIPYLPGSIKQQLLEIAVDLFVTAMADKTTLDERVEGFLAA